ncbi:major Facilitator Superfamily (MFS) [Achlya hypogyna]|uniref:Major Facilitator Superfamily (MFS) n=1 Tax=Achlya hypogyna TaxID=1202772 RepID=A0A1V9Y5D8_ACHHY|nr:major Facilitator Superfamily (MFS) [Achlya hypogyna]
MGCVRTYWTIALQAKPAFEAQAEEWVFYWRKRQGVKDPLRCCCGRFHRAHIFIAVFFVQFCAGSLYALETLADPINAHFAFAADSTAANILLYEAGFVSILAQAVIGPLLERTGPSRSMFYGTLGLTLGLIVAQIAVSTMTWPLLHVGCDIMGVAFGAIIITSICTVEKWCPDLRGTVTGACLFGFGLGAGLWRSLFHAVLGPTNAGFERIFWLMLVVLLPILSVTTVVLRTPPSDFSVNGHDMHCIPSDKAPNVAMVQDEFLRVGMTLVNYKAIMSRTSASAEEGTERQYHEQVKALTLLQCILSTDFLCLYVAYGANSLAGMLYAQVAAPRLDGDLLVDWFAVPQATADHVRLLGIVADLVGRLAVPILSDVIIRIFYANPAVVRKVCFGLLLAIQGVALPVVYFAAPTLDSFANVAWLLYIVQFSTNGGACLIACFLTDMYGVYHVGTMYGLILTTWPIAVFVNGVAPSSSKNDFAAKIQLFWYASLLGLTLLLLVRTNSTDRFYRGYRLTLCGKTLIQVPYAGPEMDSTTGPVDIDDDDGLDDTNNGSFVLWPSASNLSSTDEDPFYEEDAERWLVFWPLSSRVERYPRFQCLRFHRLYIFFAAFVVQLFCGALYAVLSLANPINAYFGFGPNGDEATHLLFAAGSISLASQALCGPLLERLGPRKSMGVSLVVLTTGLIVAQIAVSAHAWILFHIGCYLLAVAFGAMAISSISTALKWCPDLRGTVAGFCLFGYGVGSGLSRDLFHFMAAQATEWPHWMFLHVFLVAIPLLGVATLILRTPPSDFSVRGHDMHCIPLETAPNVVMVQDEFLRVGMTLVNYNAIAGQDGTDRQYHEQVKALTLLQCILSTDFLCLYVAFATNALVGFLYADVQALRVSHDLLVDWYKLSSAQAASVRSYALTADLASRLAVPILSDVSIRLFYGNPAAVRKIAFVLILLLQCAMLPIVYFGADALTNFDYVEWLFYIVQACTNGGAALIVVFLADMYGVYHVGTMYGIICTSWALGRGLVGLAPLQSVADLAYRVKLLWYFSLAGLLLMLFVRTDSIDRFYRGYQLTSSYEVDAELYVFFWPLSSDELRFPRHTWLHFHRAHVFIAVFLVQFGCGALYAFMAMANPINVYFGFPGDASAAMNLILIAGVLSIVAQAVLGPLLERQGPRWSMAVTTVLLTFGLGLALVGACANVWAIFYAAILFIGIAFGALMILTTSVAMKWCPDMRGTVAGGCLVGFGLGKELWGELYHSVTTASDVALQYILVLLLVVVVPTMVVATFVLRTPPNDFIAGGVDMHCIPAHKAPSAEMVQDEYLRIGMTLVNYRAVARRSNSLVEGTDRQYHEQVKAMSLTQCILSTDFMCLCLALTANVLVGLFFNNITAASTAGSQLQVIYGIDKETMDDIRYNGVIADLTGRLVPALFSDVCIRICYGNPAAVRKSAFSLLLLLQCIVLPIVYFHGDNMTNFAYTEWLLYTLQFASNAGTSLVVSFLTDMFGVYHVGTMYGLSASTWALGQGVLMLTMATTTDELAHQVWLFWCISLPALVIMIFVRTASMDRFYRGYQFSVCGKVVVQRMRPSWQSTPRQGTWDMYTDVPDGIEPKSGYAVQAERWVFFWPLAGGSRKAPRATCMRFHRVYVFFAAFLVQFATGSIYAISSIANPTNIYFGFSPDSDASSNIMLVSGVVSIVAQAVCGPLVERKGPRQTMAVCTLIMILGLFVSQIAVVLRLWAMLYAGVAIVAIAYGPIMLSSISTALKWGPDIRGTVTGICLFGFGLGKQLWSMLFQSLIDGSDERFRYLFWLLLAVLASSLSIASLLLRLPPKDYSINGIDMHCIPVNSAPSTSLVQDEYLRIGMTLVNYKAVARHSDSLVEGTDRHYHEQVKALSLLQCIFSSDFLCLCLALVSNAIVGLFYNEVTAVKVGSDMLRDLYGITKDQADKVRFHGTIADLTGRLIFPMLSDILVRIFYANPAAVRKGCFFVLLLLQCVVLPVVYYGGDNMSSFHYTEWLLYSLEFASNSGTSLIVCFLVDMFGVYHIGTMYGVSSLTWGIGQGVLLATTPTTAAEMAHQVQLFWWLSLAGLVLFFFVRTDAKDRFYRGYQLTVCGKAIVQRPRGYSYSKNTMDVYADVPEHTIGQRGSVPYLWSSDSLSSLDESK